MLLREYILLNLGRVTLAEATAWQADMVARRKVDGCRDLLALWRPREAGKGVLPGQVLGYVVMGVVRFGRDLSASEVEGGLLEVGRLVLNSFGMSPDPSGLQVQGKPMGQVVLQVEESVAFGSVLLEAVTMQELLGTEVDPGAVANAIAYYFEQVFGFAQAAKHPVAYEEAMRLRAGER